MRFEIKEAEEEEKIFEIYRYRYNLWREIGLLTPDNKVDDCIDEHDRHGIHWFVEDGDRVIAEARMCVHNSIETLPDSFFFEGIDLELKFPAASLNRLSVHPDYRLNGIAREMFLIRLQKAREISCDTVVGVSTQNSQRLIQSLGFIDFGTANLSNPPLWLERLMGKKEIQRKIFIYKI